MPEPEDDSQPTVGSDQDVSLAGSGSHGAAGLVDASGKVISRLVNPLGVDFHFRDVAELLVGACVLAIPISYTEEVWVLGSELPMLNAFVISLLSAAFVALFVYMKAYHGHLRKHLKPFVSRVVATYVITLVVAAVLLALLEKLPVGEDPATALRRIFLVAFPAAFSATVVDSLK
jgi:uncharacterized membrane protein